MIDEAQTLQLYGYTSDMLKQQSNKKDVWYRLLEA